MFEKFEMEWCEKFRMESSCWSFNCFPPDAHELVVLVLPPAAGPFRFPHIKRFDYCCGFVHFANCNCCCGNFDDHDCYHDCFDYRCFDNHCDGCCCSYCSCYFGLDRCNFFANYCPYRDHLNYFHDFKNLVDLHGSASPVVHPFRHVFV